MDLITKISIPSVAEENQLSYTTPVVSMGSCFATHLQEKFDYYKLPSFAHPFGTLFHPLPKLIFSYKMTYGFLLTCIHNGQTPLSLRY